jgi:hypothetical protein
VRPLRAGAGGAGGAAGPAAFGVVVAMQLRQ